ncbi:hypothetical protein ACXWQW_09425, partial [Streptococcus pyogenes]
MAETVATPTHICSGSLGILRFPRLLIADSHWSRLRGWYGYQAGKHTAALDAVLLTRTACVQTVAMNVGLDLFWLDKN